MRRTTLPFLLLVAGCSGEQDRLTDEQAMRQAAPGQEQLSSDSAATVPAASAVLTEEPGEIVYKALGTEPGWALTVRENAMLYQGGDGAAGVIEATPPGFAPRSGTYRSGRLAITIARGPCSDGLSDHLWRDKVTVALTAGGVARGCGGGLVAVSAAKGSWTVTAVNGRPTGGGERYALTLADGEVRASFGCNGLSGRVDQNGNRLSVRDLIGTQMLCGEPADRLEREGAAVLNGQPRFEQARGRARLVSEAGTIDLAPPQQEGPTA